MNVNGAHFRLLLGRDDWSRCLDGDDDSASLLDGWWAAQASPMPELPATLPAWNAVRHELMLQPLPIELPPTEGETRLELAARRASAADRHGNVYRVADDHASLRVSAYGGNAEAVFWPAAPADCAPERERARLVFQAQATVSSRPGEHYLALTVTADDYLVAAFARQEQRGLMSFDLIAGGPPVETLWPATVAFEPFAMCPRHPCGAWILDRTHLRLWELDGTLAVVNTGQPLQPLAAPALDDFQPLSGSPRGQAATAFPGGLDLLAAPVLALDPIAIQPLESGGLLLLDRDTPLQRSRVLRLRRSVHAWRADASHWLHSLPALAHDMVHAAAPRFRDTAGQRLFISSGIGNQVHAFEVIDTAEIFMLQVSAELYPLRRHGGRALIRLRGDAYYDNGSAGLKWLPVVQQPRQRFAARAEFVTPVFDSTELGTTWDKVLLDACIPPDTEVEIDSRCGDDSNDAFGDAASPAAPAQLIASWLPEPSPRLRGNGSELPWLRHEATRATHQAAGAGTWELLLQRAQGRYLQLRIRLISRSGTDTPRLRALRAWFPRFSYPQRFLPAVYREDGVQGAFLERWLANFESTLTQVEDRLVQVQALFDARSTPAETLPWLARWFDLALDPGWDERRHRLLVQHAMDFFRWRGTVHGLRLALDLAFDRCFDPEGFAGPREGDDSARRIRIVEAWQTRLITMLANQGTGPAPLADGPRLVQRATLWSPAQGNADLASRYALWLGREAGMAEQITPFSLVPPADAEAVGHWRAFCQATLGFVPGVGAAERNHWQAYLQARYISHDDMNRALGTSYNSFASVSLPTAMPGASAARDTWQDFCSRREGRRERRLWSDFLARRYRRIERLQRAHGSNWPGFELVALPDSLPATWQAQLDWLQFEGRLLAMHRGAHRFSVLLPVDSVQADPWQLEQRLGLARRIVDLEKPAHTVFDVRFYWAFNRVGEARLGLDTQLGTGSRASELIPDAVVGRAYLGASFVGGPTRQHGSDRLSIDC